jgi:hypothetical protein
MRSPVPGGGRIQITPNLGENGAMHAGGGASGDTARSAATPVQKTWVTGLLVSLVIVGPTFFAEEFWHGAPLIDRGGASWVVPAAVMALGFSIGGVIAGYRQRRVSHALIAGLLVSGLTIAAVFGGDLIRRHALGQGMLFRVMEYWVGAVGSSLLVGGIGGVTGYWMAGRTWAQRPVRLRDRGSTGPALVRR